jgi:hypothetical protein
LTNALCERRNPTRTGDRVAFKISDAFLPGSEEIRAGFWDVGEVEGTIMDFSDSGTAARAFALVEVVHKQTIVVPTERLRILGTSGSSNEPKN